MVFLEEISIWIGGLKKPDLLPNVSGLIQTIEAGIKQKGSRRLN